MPLVESVLANLPPSLVGCMPCAPTFFETLMASKPLPLACNAESSDVGMNEGPGLRQI